MHIDSYWQISACRHKIIIITKTAIRLILIVILILLIIILISLSDIAVFVLKRAVKPPTNQ